MKVLHIADLHLDSRMETNLSSAKARERKNEILLTFKRCIEFADSENVDSILIAGDMFDRKNVSKTVIDTVISIINSYPEITFYCLKGNHGDVDAIDYISEKASNVFRFTEKWTSYALDEGGVVILTAAELSNDDEQYDSLKLDENKINIVMLHGQKVDGYTANSEAEIPLGLLAGRGIDYLALGHIHSYSSGRIDQRGIYVYPGCMESRGFDEYGRHGIVLMDIDLDRRSVSHKLISIENRSCVNVEIDVSDCSNAVEVEKIVATVFQNISSRNLVEARLVGELSMDSYIDMNYLQKVFENDFYFLKWKNMTTVSIDIDSYENEISLKGEFVRRVKADSSLTDEQKKKIIYMGIRALRGEDVSYEAFKD